MATPNNNNGTKITLYWYVTPNHHYDLVTPKP
jgi:hypothetical protein